MMSFVHNLSYILLMTNIFSLAAVLMENNKTSNEQELKKKTSSKLTEDKKIMIADTIDQAKTKETVEKQDLTDENGLTVEKPVQEKSIKGVSRTNENVIDFNEAREIKKQESDNLKKQPLKKLVWHFPE